MAKKQNDIYRISSFSNLVGAEMKLYTRDGGEFEGVLKQLNVLDGVGFLVISDKTQGDQFINAKTIANFSLIKFDQPERERVEDNRPCVTSNKGKPIKGCEWRMALYDPKCDGCKERPTIQALAEKGLL